MRTDTLFRVGGCSGSFAAPSENRTFFDANAPWQIRRSPFRRDIYGGRTSSYFLRHKQTFFVIDHGLGIEPVSEFILDILASEGKKEAVIHCLQTHFHDDHWSGMQANLLLFQPGLTLRFYSPELVQADPHGTRPARTTMQQVLKDCFSSVKKYWPVTLETLDEIGAQREHISFRPGETLTIDGIAIHTIELAHPDGCCGYRFEIPRAGPLIMATDYEAPDSPDPAVVDFFDGARLLLSDMQYRDFEYDGRAPLGRLTMPRRGWGHGTPSRVFPILLRCPQPPQALWVVHHEPKRSDMELRLFYEETVNLRNDVYRFSRSLEYQFTHDGDVYWL